jgi:hypothetical protein
MSIAESVRRAGYNVTSGRSEDYGSLGCRMLKTERVRNYFNKLKEKEYNNMVLSIGEKRAFLARAVRCDVANPDRDLVQEQVETTSEHGKTTKLKVVDKLRALELDSKIAGDFYDDRQPQVSNPFMLIVQLGKSGVSSGTLADDARQAVSVGQLPHPAPLVMDADIVADDATA